MSHSVLLTIARKSIEEILQAEQSINRAELLEQYPVLGEMIATQITLYHGNKVRGTSKSDLPVRTLLEDIIRNAKIAAFQDSDFSPITTSEYLHTSVELTLFTADGPLSHKDAPILQES